MVYLNGNRIVPSHGKLNDRQCGILEYVPKNFQHLCGGFEHVHIPLFLVQS